jgi:molybdate transport system substrate-binding protein
MRDRISRRSVAFAVLATLLGVAAGSAQPAKPLTVFAAASLTDAFNAMKPQFEKEHPGTEVRLNFGASSQLRTQIEQGAPVDVFASADTVQIQPLVGAKLVGAPVIFARNRLVVALPSSNPGRVRSLRDLARPGLKIVTTAESVPIGKYTQQVLEKLGAENGADYTQKVNANVVSRESNVRGVLAKVELGEADAAFVYETDAASTRKVSVIKIPEKSNVIAEYPIAVVNAARDRPLAEAWVRFTLSRSGKGTLKRFGFR